MYESNFKLFSFFANRIYVPRLYSRVETNISFGRAKNARREKKGGVDGKISEG